MELRIRGVIRKIRVIFKKVDKKTIEKLFY